MNVNSSVFIVLVFSLAFVLFILGFIYVKAEAVEAFGIRLDNTCITMLSNNITTTCPTYEDLLTVFPDTSNQDASGRFVYIDGVYQRGPEKLVDSFEYYRFRDNPVLFVDPPAKTAERVKLIEIRANLDEYLLRGEEKTYNATDHSITMGTKRYVDPRCRVAYIDASDWILRIGDTMQYIQNNCDPKYTTYNDRINTKLHKVTHDIATSYKYKLEQWQKEAIARCGTKICLYEDDKPAP